MKQSGKTRTALVLAAAAALLLGAAAPARAFEDVRVSVVAILASGGAKKVDPELEAIATEVRKKCPNLTGFHLARMTCLPVPVGKEETFPLEDDQKAAVAVQQGPDKNDRIRLKVKPPQLNDITYSTCTGKYFPIVTPYRTKAKEQLIIAIMVSPGRAP
jgi:hypothetical protein